jgi:hypothetical protein
MLEYYSTTEIKMQVLFSKNPDFFASPGKTIASGQNSCYTEEKGAPQCASPV